MVRPRGFFYLKNEFERKRTVECYKWTINQGETGRFFKWNLRMRKFHLKKTVWKSLDFWMGSTWDDGKSILQGMVLFFLEMQMYVSTQALHLAQIDRHSICCLFFIFFCFFFVICRGKSRHISKMAYEGHFAWCQRRNRVTMDCGNGNRYLTCCI